MMPWWRLLVAVVVLLLPLVSTQDTPPFTPPTPIDLNNIHRGDGYFIRQSCDSSDVNVDSKLALFSNSRNIQCDIILHTRKLGNKKLLVEIDIHHMPSIIASAKLDKTKSVKIIQGTFTLECKPDGKVEATDTTKPDSGIKIVKKPKVSFEDNRIYCTFIIKSEFKIGDNFQSNGENPKLQFVLASGTDYALEYGSKGRSLWEIGSNDNCDPDLPSTLDSPFGRRGIYLEPLKDITNLKCDKGRLYVVEDYDSFHYVDSVNCQDGYWVKTIGNKQPIKLNDPFTVMCGAKLCAQCTNLPPIECANPYTCKDPDPITTRGDDCAKISCGHDQWFLEVDGRMEWVDKPIFECVQNKTGRTVWKANEVEVKKGSCTEDYDCFIHSHLILECTSIDAPCLHPIKTIIEGTQKIVCDPGFILKLCDGDNCEEIKSSSLDCQKNNGLFSNGPNTINPGSIIGCYETEESIKAYEASLDSPATGSIDILFVPIAVVGVLALIGLAVGVFFLIKPSVDLCTDVPLYRGASLKLRKEPPPPPQEPVVVAPARKKKKKREQSGPAARQGRHKKWIDEGAKKEKNSSTGNSSSGSVQSVQSGSKQDKKSKKSSQSTQSNNSKKSKKSNKWPKDFRRRKFNRARVIPPMDKCEINKTTAYPCPRFASKCPDEYSTSMDIQNPRLVELLNREKPTTVSKSMQNPEGDGKGAPIPKSDVDKKTPK